VYNASEGKLMARAYLLGGEEWIIFDDEGRYCGSQDSERYLRIDRVSPGLIWNSHATVFLGEEDKKEFRLNCPVDQRDVIAPQSKVPQGKAK
jgi:hypothetical protein